MAWHIEQNTGDLVIDGWDKGIAPDPYSGANQIYNANINTVLGEVSVGFPLTAASTSGATLGVPISRATALSAGSLVGYFILDDTGQVFSSTTMTGTWTYLASNSTLTGASSLDCLFYYKGYLFKTRTDHLDYWTGSTWVNGWNPANGGSGAGSIISTATTHFALVGQDDVVYITNGSGVASLFEKAGQTFDPTNTATFTYNAKPYNANALAIPSYDSAISLAELGVNLLVGGTQNAIYPWNRIATTYSYPIICSETFMNRMVTANNNVFIFTGQIQGN